MRVKHVFTLSILLIDSGMIGKNVKFITLQLNTMKSESLDTLYMCSIQYTHRLHDNNITMKYI